MEGSDDPPTDRSHLPWDASPTSATMLVELRKEQQQVDGGSASEPFSPPVDVAAPSLPLSTPVPTRGSRDGDVGSASALMRGGSIFPVLVAVSAGVILALVLAFTPFLLFFSALDTDCALLRGAITCNSTSYGRCVWSPSKKVCLFPNHETVICPANVSQHACERRSGCVYRYRDSECVVAHGWSAAEQGMFAGFFVISAIVAPVAFPPFIERLGARRTVLLLGAIVAVGAALTNVGWAAERNFAILVLSRVTFGVAIGLGFIVSNSYPNEMALPEWRNIIGALVSTSIPVTIFLFTIVAYFSRPTNLSDAPLRTSLRIHLLVGWFWVAAGLLVLLGFFMPESSAWTKAQCVGPSGGSRSVSLQGAALAKMAAVWAFARHCRKSLLVTFAVFAAQQMSGINALSVFLPQIASELTGVEPLLAALIFSALAALFAPLGPILATRLHPRTLFVFGCLAVGIALLLAATASMPIVGASNTTRGVVVSVALLCYMAVYQATLGPAAFLLSVSMFEPKHLPSGMCFASTVLNTWSFLCTTLFPVMVEGISGGPSGDQNVGLAWTFVVFAFAAFVPGLIVLLAVPRHR